MVLPPGRNDARAIARPSESFITKLMTRYNRKQELAILEALRNALYKFKTYLLTFYLLAG